MEHKNKIIELIKASIASEKFSINRYNPYGGIHYPGSNINNSNQAKTNNINVNFRDEPIKFTDKVTSFYGFYHLIDPGNIIYEDYDLTFRISFEDPELSDIYLTRFPLKFSPNERVIGFLDKIKAIFLFKKVIKSSIDIDFSVNHGVLTMGEVSFNLNPHEYNKFAKDTIDLLIARRDFDAQKEILKIDNTIKGL